MPLTSNVESSALAWAVASATAHCVMISRCQARVWGKLLLTGWVACAWMGACSSGPTPRGDIEASEQEALGGLHLRLTVPVGLQINAILYDVVDTSTGLTVLSKQADVSSADAQARAFILLPPGSYVVNLHAASFVSPCSGSSAPFNIVAGSNTTASAALVCGTASQPSAGGVVLDAGFTHADQCGIADFFAGPLMQGVGHDVTLGADVVVASPNPTYSWSSSVAIGTFASASSLHTAFTCNTAGTTQLQLTVQDYTCVATQAVDVTCVQRAVCGNGTQEAGEACDDGNVLANDGCAPDCTREVCGDGVLQGVEQCDDGNVTSGDGCDATCKLEPVCGNGLLEAGESCDDGNVFSNDGCSASCQLELCGDGIRQAVEECDDGNLLAGDGCDGSCYVEVPCGIIDLFVAPLQQGVGRAITLAATVQGSPRATSLWTQDLPTIGSFANATQAATSFTCTTPGSTWLNYTLSDGVCGASVSVPVTCR